MEGWVVNLTAVLPTGNLTQCFPDFIKPATVNPATATNGQLIRRPCEGELMNTTVRTDGIDGGYIEIWDINGADAGANVSTATAITNAQLVTLQGLGIAKLIFTQNFSASSLTPFNAYPRGFQRGLAARYVNYTVGPDTAVGTCILTAVVKGGFQLVEKIG